MSTVNTLLLNRREIQQLLDPVSVLPSLKDAFSAHSRSQSIPPQRHRSDLPGPGTSTILFPGTTKAIPAYSVKVHAKFPSEQPAIRGALLLFSNDSGNLLAVMDSTYLTAVRTGLASALAADLLARNDASTVAVIGAGAQGRFQLRFLNALRSLDRVRIFDTNEENAVAFRHEMTEEMDCPIESTDTLEAALEGAGIVLSATWAREPFLTPELLDTGAHISTLGADEPGKAEVSAELVRRSLFICDDRELAVRMGAAGNVGLGSEEIDAELGEVIAGVHPGRSHDDEITVFGSVGLAFQDLVVGWKIYQCACEHDAGTPYEFLTN